MVDAKIGYGDQYRITFSPFRIKIRPQTAQLLPFSPLSVPATVVDPTRGPLPRPQRELDDEKLSAGAYRFEASLGDAQYAVEERNRAVATISDMVARALEDILEWVRVGTKDGAEAAYVATGRVLAGSPLSVEALHLRGVALHLLGR